MTAFVRGELHAIVILVIDGKKPLGNHPCRRGGEASIGRSQRIAADRAQAGPTTATARKEDKNSVVLREIGGSRCQFHAIQQNFYLLGKRIKILLYCVKLTSRSAARMAAARI